MVIPTPDCNCKGSLIPKCRRCAKASPFLVVKACQGRRRLNTHHVMGVRVLTQPRLGTLVAALHFGEWFTLESMAQAHLPWG